MKADTKELPTERFANPEGAAADPFAVDLFVLGRAASESAREGLASQVAAESENPSLIQSWNLRLPQVTPGQVEASAAMAALTPEFYSRVRSSVVNVLSRYSMTAVDQVSVSLADLQETDFSSATLPTPGTSVFATFNLETNAIPLSFELDTRFAATFIDRMLGGEGTPPDLLRALTKIERAVIEFLSLSLVSELNSQLRQPLLRLQSVSEQPPWWSRRIGIGSEISASTLEVWNRGLAISLRIDIGEISGVVHAYLNLQALSALEESRRHLRGGGQTYSLSERTGEIDRYSRVAPDVGLAVLIGKTDVTLQELFELECGDVMLVDRPSVRWRNQQIKGSLAVRVGDADETLIYGDLAESGNSDLAVDAAPESSLEADEALQDGALNITVGKITVTPPLRLAERLKMEEDVENGESLAEGANLIEGVMLTVRVELGARRLLLDELSRLRPNQILDLGCKATDPVDLIVDGRRIARGDLVDIEGRLGVRITQLPG